jgi:hypothetical protein
MKSDTVSQLRDDLFRALAIDPDAYENRRFVTAFEVITSRIPEPKTRALLREPGTPVRLLFFANDTVFVNRGR